MMRFGLAAIALLAAAPAFAQNETHFCPQRPSLGSSACITDPGHVQFEMSSIDWQRDDTADQREDVILGGDFQARFGITRTTELQIGWTPVGRVHTRDKTEGTIDTRTGVGDIQFGLRQNFRNPDGKGLSFGAEPFVTLPVGREPIGAGDWGAGLVVPVSYDLSDAVQASFTGEADAAVDEDGHGRHFAYGGIVGLGYALTRKITAVGELSVLEDDDPAHRHTEIAAAGSLAWQARKGFQVDVLAVAGLNHDTPDLRLVTGGAILF